MADAPDVTDPTELAARRKADKEKKAAEKAAKAAEKEARQKQRESSAANKATAAAADAGGEAAAAVDAPSVTLRDYADKEFGELFIQSHIEGGSGRKFVKVDELLPSLVGQQVWVRARVATSRKQGKMLCFLQLRQQMFTAQAVVFSKTSDIVAWAASLPRESVVDVLGELTCPEQPIASCSQSTIELQVKQLFCVSRAKPELPLQLEDAGRPDAELEANPELPRVHQDVRLNHRILDLRTPCNQAIFRMQSGVCQLFRGFLRTQVTSPNAVPAHPAAPSFHDLRSPSHASAASAASSERRASPRSTRPSSLARRARAGLMSSRSSTLGATRTHLPIPPVATPSSPPRARVSSPHHPVLTCPLLTTPC